MTAGLTELGVRCPSCWAPPGERCTANGEYAESFHAGRISEVARASRPREARPRDAVARPPWFPEQGTPQPLVQYSAEVMDEAHVGKRWAGYVRVTVDAGPRGVEGRHENPAWARRVEVSVSPAGRSARVWVDGREIPIERSTPDGE